ncbi:MAG: hypothetical protein HC896_00425 [Bacteroidales bacterium]|nr:hypothetical protein [Bacteroidales bacterium]
MEIKQKRQRFNALLAKGKLVHAKAAILDSYGVDSTMKLSDVQLEDAINRVELMIKRSLIDAEKPVRAWRHKCLRVIRECEVDTNDWQAVNAFMMDKRVAGKPLYELTIDELPVLHRKLHNIRDNKREKQQEQRQQISRLSIHN